MTGYLPSPQLQSHKIHAPMTLFEKARKAIDGSPVEKPAQILLNGYRSATHYPVNKLYERKYSGLRETQKIIYGVTPPARLRNIGDHAQAVAIHTWLSNHFGDYDIHEVDKDDSYRYIDGLQSITSEKDPIFLHSGGNMGDRGMWSEQARRRYINKFPNNPIVSLPQTIYFSNSERGKKELKKSKTIYNQHGNLTIIARDEYSYKFAQEHFHNCNVLVAPDFVLSLSYDLGNEQDRDILLCLRRDEESILSSRDRSKIEHMLAQNGLGYTNYDTTLPKPIRKSEREQVLLSNLEIFSNSNVIVTDRFHGIIFSVITGRPCVALETADHKVSESIKWFNDLPIVKLASNIEKIPEMVNMVEQADRKSLNWNERHFRPLADEIRELI